MHDVDKITCDVARERLTEFVDRELSEPQAAGVASHLIDCDDCLAAFESEQRLMEGLRRRIAEIRMPDEVRARLWGVLRDSVTDVSQRPSSSTDDDVITVRRTPK